MKTNNQYSIGQRWLSIAEPELGLGIITELPEKNLKLFFKTSNITRFYNRKVAPLKRVVFEVGDKLKLVTGDDLEVAAIEMREGIFYYGDATHNFHAESEIDDTTRFNNPEEKIFSGQIDSDKLFKLRYKTHELRAWPLRIKTQGLVGPRVSLLPHQFFIASKMIHNQSLRALLSDEVGLGKTIEAGLIIHALLKRGEIERVAIIVPDSLTYQWFVEFYRKFSLSFKVINRETVLEKDSNPFRDHQLVIIGFGLLKGSEIARDLLNDATFDLLVVDEAHQLKWEGTGSDARPSEEFSIVEHLSKRCDGLILLSATPVGRGSLGHFSRLRLLDPHKFSDFDKFKQDEDYFLELSEKAQQLLTDESLNETEKQQRLNELIDINGPGKIIYRNSRKKMSEVFDFFPKRKLEAYVLNIDLKIKPHYKDVEAITLIEETKLLWLFEKLTSLKGEKILLITRSKNRVLFLEKRLKEIKAGIKTAVFHSDLSLQARDRQAAYFAQSDGADILLCTEIGSEGRNFEFAANLVLFDLPLHPDLLEQRIGRLDRIGQRRDITIHVPYIVGTFEEKLFKFYHEGLGSFENHSQSFGEVFEIYKKELKNYLENDDVPEFGNFLKKVHDTFLEVHKKIENGKDVLIELNSYNDIKAQSIINEIKEIDNDKQNRLAHYMEEVFEEFGVVSDSLGGSRDESRDELNTYIKPSDNMFIPSFPCLPDAGMSFTYNRARALSREDLQFLTWDHPMVQGVMELILGSGFGNATVVERISKKPGAKSFLEIIFISESVAPRNLNPVKFYPPTPIRVLINSDGIDKTESFAKEEIDSKVIPLSKNRYHSLKTIPKDKIKDLIKKASCIASEKQKNLGQNAIELMEKCYGEDIERLNKLGEGESQDAKKLYEKIKILRESFERANIYFDAIRLIL